MSLKNFLKFFHFSIYSLPSFVHCEFIVDTAKRELKEETGAKDFTLEPVCIYGVEEGDGEETYGMLCVADITSFEPFDSEIEKIVITDTLTVASINVSKSDSVEAGQVIITLN